MKLYRYAIHTFQELATSQKEPTEFFNELGAQGLRVVNILVRQSPSHITSLDGTPIPYIIFQLTSEEEYEGEPTVPAKPAGESPILV